MLRYATWVFFAGTMYLILCDVVRHWVVLPDFGDTGFTLVFVLFALLHCAASAGWKTTGWFFGLAAAVTFALEETGVRSGLVYGVYHYSDMLGPKLGHVPVLVPLAWFMMIYPSWVVARALLRGVNTGSAAGVIGLASIAAMAMTGWDAVMDPGMSAAGNWIWEQGGSYFGVPLRNYLGWLVTTFLVYLGWGWLGKRERPIGGTGRGFAALPIVVYTFHGVSYVTPRTIPALQIVALFAMILPGVVALLQTLMARDDAA